MMVRCVVQQDDDHVTRLCIGMPRPNEDPEPFGVARFTSTLLPASACMRPLANTLSTAASSS